MRQSGCTDTQKETALWLFAILCTILFSLCSRSLIPLVSWYRMDIVVALSLMAASTGVVLWNLGWVVLARLTHVRWFPQHLRHRLRERVERSGTRLARRVLLRASSSILVGTSALSGIGVGAAFAASPDVNDMSQSTHALHVDPRFEDLSWSGSADTLAHATRRSLEQAPDNALSRDATELGVATVAPCTPTSTTQVSGLTSPPNTQSMSPRENVYQQNFIQTYTVKPGDTLSLIALGLLNNHPGDVAVTHAWQRIYESNIQTIGTNPNVIFPGQVLVIPEDLS
nr:LysM peptidoglycan-binding domain-containing protein [Schaalia sp. ZJ405]